MNDYVLVLDYLGVVLFAASGALSASRRELDILGFVFFAILTGIGGGTVRDIVLDVDVFWVEAPAYLIACSATAAILFFTAHLIEYRYRALQWLDAAAVALFAVLGAQKGLMITGSPSVAILMGAMTATLGGILRDTLAGEPNAITRPEIYVTAAVVGASATVALLSLGLDGPIAALLGGLVAFALRGGALAFGWRLPRYRARPGRPIDKA